MTWHYLPELPKWNTEVLAEVEGWKYARYTVLKWDGKYWWQHLPPLGKPMINDSWVGIGEITATKRWAYIEEE